MINTKFMILVQERQGPGAVHREGSKDTCDVLGNWVTGTQVLVLIFYSFKCYYLNCTYII